MIAMKREVAARKWQVFRGANVKLGNWRQVTVQIIESTIEWKRPCEVVENTTRTERLYGHRLSC